MIRAIAPFAFFAALAVGAALIPTQEPKRYPYEHPDKILDRYGVKVYDFDRTIFIRVEPYPRTHRESKPQEWKVSYCDCGYHLYRNGVEIVLDHEIGEKVARDLLKEAKEFGKYR